MKKRCSKCKVEKSFEDFYADKRSKDGLNSCCKKCHYAGTRLSKIANRDRTNISQRKAYHKNPERFIAYSKKYHSKHKTSFSEYNKRWKKENKEKVIEYQRVYRKEHREAISRKTNLYVKERRKTDIAFRLKQILRTRLGHALNGKLKHGSTIDLLGCSTKELQRHLEEQWVDGMNWDNYGTKGWHIDHIIPCCQFDLSNPEDQKRCFHFSNLQPLWWNDNLRKGGQSSSINNA